MATINVHGALLILFFSMQNGVCLIRKKDGVEGACSARKRLIGGSRWL